MLIIFPAAVFVSLFFTFLGRVADVADQPPDWRKAFLQACVVWGGVIGIGSEVLSLFEAITPPWIALLWGLVLLAIGLVGKDRRYLFSTYTRLRSGFPPKRPSDPIAWFSFAGILLVLLVVALASPPNNTDSLLYHMPRVAHWIQNASLRHYPTAFEPQLWNSIWAEEAILHLRIAWGSDGLVGLVQWFSLLGSVVGVSAIARLLGASQRGQLAAAAFTLSVPMAVLQASSTQNDLVTAFWVVCSAYFVLLAERRPLHLVERASLSLAIGAGILTKPIFYSFALPLLVKYAHTTLRRVGIRRAMAEMAWPAGGAVLMNAGFWIRNTITFGGPFASERLIAARTNLAELTFARWVTTLISNLSLQFATPIDAATNLVEGLVLRLHAWLGVSPGDYQLVSAWNHEDVASNPLHLVIAAASLGVLVRHRRKVPATTIGSFAGLLVAGFSIHSLVFAWQPYGSRFQLPFFVTWGAVFGATLSLAKLDKLAVRSTHLLIIVALPWVLLNRTRPVIGIQPWTATESIFTISKEEILFASWPVWRGQFTSAVEHIETAGCNDVGLRIDSHDFEYMLWWLFGAPESGVRIETVYTYPHLERYVDSSFTPCAIVCTICGGRDRLHGLQIAASFQTTSVYLGDSFSPEIDG